MEDHGINGTSIMPGAGMLMYTVEAVRQIKNEGRVISSYRFRDIDFQNWLSSRITGEETKTHFFIRRDTRRST